MNQFASLGVSTSFFEIMRLVPDIEASWSRRGSENSGSSQAADAEWEASDSASAIAEQVGDSPAQGSRFAQYEAKYWAWLRARHDSLFASFREFARVRAGVRFLQKHGLLEQGPRQLQGGGSPAPGPLGLRTCGRVRGNCTEGVLSACRAGVGSLGGHSQRAKPVVRYISSADLVSTSASFCSDLACPHQGHRAPAQLVLATLADTTGARPGPGATAAHGRAACAEDLLRLGRLLVRPPRPRPLELVGIHVRVRGLPHLPELHVQVRLGGRPRHPQGGLAVHLHGRPPHARGPGPQPTSGVGVGAASPPPPQGTPWPPTRAERRRRRRLVGAGEA
jgi:hypothetical protein